MEPDYPDHETDRRIAAEWARTILAQGALILDTETTGLGDDAEIVQVAILTTDGRTVLDSLVRPTRPIPPGATAVHGITDEIVRVAPDWRALWPAIAQVLGGRVVVVYNAAYDTRLIRQSCMLAEIRASIDRVAEWHCAMLPYAAWVGDWNSYRGNYRWQKLPSGDHSALGDCRATLTVLHQMAATTTQPEGV